MQNWKKWKLAPYNKYLAPGKSWKINNRTPTFIPDSRVHNSILLIYRHIFNPRDLHAHWGEGHINTKGINATSRLKQWFWKGFIINNNTKELWYQELSKQTNLTAFQRTVEFFRYFLQFLKNSIVIYLLETEKFIFMSKRKNTFIDAYNAFDCCR